MAYKRLCCLAFSAVFALFFAVASSYLLHLRGEQLVTQVVSVAPRKQTIYDSASPLQYNLATEYKLLQVDNWWQYFFKGEQPSVRVGQLLNYSNQIHFEVGDYTSEGRLQADMTRRMVKQEQPQTPFSLPNLAPFVLWHAYSSESLPQVSLRALGLLTREISLTLRQVLISKGLAGSYLDSRESCAALLAEAGISGELQGQMLEDLNYGICVQYSMFTWIEMALRPPFSSEYNHLKRYFYLQDEQIAFLHGRLAEWVGEVEQQTYEGHYCQILARCDKDYLIAAQIAESALTLSPPSILGTKEDLTICQHFYNCFGYPELSAFKDAVLPDKYPHLDFRGVNFEVEDVLRMIDYREGTTAEDLLLHIGNLRSLWGNGTLFTETNNSNYLALIRQRFRLRSEAHALVLFEWVKYLAEELAPNLEQSSLEYNYLWVLSSLNFKAGMQQVLAWLKPFVVSTTFADRFANLTCADLFTKSTSLGPAAADCLCMDLNSTMVQLAQTLYKGCQNSSVEAFQLIRDKLQLHIYELCSRDGYFYRLVNQVQKHLYDLYNCDGIAGYHICRDEFLVKAQLLESTITLRPPSHSLKPSLVLKDWNPFLPVYQISQFNNASGGTAALSSSSLFDLLSKNHILFGRTQQFKAESGIVDYLRWLLINNQFGGSEKTVAPEAALFGYVEPILNQYKDYPRQLGGDPSFDTTIRLSTLGNQSFSFELSSGQTDAIPGKVYSVNGSSFINIQKLAWNGNQTYTSQVALSDENYNGTLAFTAREKALYLHPLRNNYPLTEMLGSTPQSSKDLSFKVYRLRFGNQSNELSALFNFEVRVLDEYEGLTTYNLVQAETLSGMVTAYNLTRVLAVCPNNLLFPWNICLPFLVESELLTVDKERLAQVLEEAYLNESVRKSAVMGLDLAAMLCLLAVVWLWCRRGQQPSLKQSVLSQNSSASSVY